MPLDADITVLVTEEGAVATMFLEKENPPNQLTVEVEGIVHIVMKAHSAILKALVYRPLCAEKIRWSLRGARVDRVPTCLECLANDAAR